MKLNKEIKKLSVTKQRQAIQRNSMYGGQSQEFSIREKAWLPKVRYGDFL